MSFIDEDYVNIVPQDLLQRGIRLREELGFYDIAWRFDDVMEVLKVTRDKGMIIVGGDVYRLSGNKPIITYDYWSTKAEDDNAFELAIQYITNYRAKNGDDFAYCQPLAPDRCPNENFGFQYRICWFCSYSDKYKNVCRTECQYVRRWDIKDFGGGFERQ